MDRTLDITATPEAGPLGEPARATNEIGSGDPPAAPQGRLSPPCRRSGKRTTYGEPSRADHWRTGLRRQAGLDRGYAGVLELLSERYPSFCPDKLMRSCFTRAERDRRAFPEIFEYELRRMGIVLDGGLRNALPPLQDEGNIATRELRAGRLAESSLHKQYGDRFIPIIVKYGWTLRDAQDIFRLSWLKVRSSVMKTEWPSISEAGFDWLYRRAQKFARGNFSKAEKRQPRTQELLEIHENRPPIYARCIDDEVEAKDLARWIKAQACSDEERCVFDLVGKGHSFAEIDVIMGSKPGRAKYVLGRARQRIIASFWRTLN